MKKLLLTLFALSSSLLAVKAQSWLWARQGINASNRECLNDAYSITMDKFNNVYETGKYDGDTVIFGSDTLFGSPFSMYLTKYNENGNILWAKSSENSRNGNCEGNGVISDYMGNAYITGQFQDTIYFQSFSLISPSKNYQNAFLVKYDATGSVLWARQSFTTSKTVTAGYSNALDKFGKYIYMTGFYQNSVSFGADTLKGTFNPNIFLVKYDSSGNEIWTKQGVNSITGYSEGYSVITDNVGYVYVAGFFQDTITFGAYTLTNPTLYQFNLFIVKYDSNGNVIWAKQPTLPKGPSSAYGDVLGKDYTGNIYVTGYFYDTVSFGASTFTSPYLGSSSIFWAKYDANGNLLWAKQAHNPDSLQWFGWSITSDDRNNLYLTARQANAGTPKAKIIFGTDTLQSKVKDGAVWLKFDSNGIILNSYIFPTGGGGNANPTIVDSSGCYVYYGGTTLDTTIVFGNDTVGSNFRTFLPFVARWSDNKCSYDGINNIENQNFNINLYPNPNNGIFNLVCHSESATADEETLPILQIYNELGEQVLTRTLRSIQYDNTINFSNKPSGIYLYRVISQNSNLLSSGKFIIQ